MHQIYNNITQIKITYTPNTSYQPIIKITHFLFET